MLDTFYPQPVAHVSETVQRFLGCRETDAARWQRIKNLEGSGRQRRGRSRDAAGRRGGKVVATSLAQTHPELSREAYLKLHPISHRKVKPRNRSDRAIRSAAQVAWTTKGRSTLKSSRTPAGPRLKGSVLEVSSVDKFPKMTNYVVPAGVRIAHTARVRLGAYLGEGTTVMHEGFINFNAGTAGPG
ncbi:MAG: hypothetical protein CM15mP92_1600 [Halieaceae bacterium]|nr:MAG: hypothetical protein CM15mP92_1600 [Halieaceae bacterium]